MTTNVKQLEIRSNRVFAPVHKAKHRYVVMKGSAGSGKSVDTAQQYIIKLLAEPGRNLMCVRKIEGSNKNSTYPELIGAINRLGLQKEFTSTVSPLRITCVRNNNEVMFCGVHDEKQREKLKSINVANGKLTDVWIEEATELTQSDFEIIDDRLRGELPTGQFYQIKLTFNPVSANHWIKKAFFDTVDKNVLTHQSTYLDNRFIDAAYHELMKRRKEVDPEGYEIYGLGNWGETSGLVFNNWKVETVPQELEHYDDISLGQDFGFNHANAILLLGIKDNEIYIIRELYVNEMDTSEIIELAKKDDTEEYTQFPTDKVMYCDAAEPDRIKMWRRAGYYAVECKKGPGSVKAQIDWIKQRPIHVDSSCINTISELGQYRWQYDSKQSVYTDEPVNFFDDAMAALRYGIQPWRIRGGFVPPKEDNRSIVQKDKERLIKQSKKKWRRV